MTPIIRLENTAGDVTDSHATTVLKPVDSRNSDPGRFEVVRALGGGGMGQVWLARDRRLDRLVALKRPRDDGPVDDEFRQRFEREGQAMARLRHPALCRIHDVAEWDGSPCLVMEYVEGASLAEALRSRGPFEEREAVRLVAAIASGLAVAHAAGIIHRDLKPGNIVLSESGEPVVVDFGLAWMQQHVPLTLPGRVMGTYAYMSPEQAEGRPESSLPRSDIYSLGVILFELVTGQTPFRGPPHSLLAQLIAQPAPAPSQLREGVSPAFDAVCVRCLAKQPDDRFQTMSELCEALRSLAPCAESGGGARVAALAADEGALTDEAQFTVYRERSLTRVKDYFDTGLNELQGETNKVINDGGPETDPSKKKKNNEKRR